ncbi:hypothetical protein D9M68_223780 [compost metagenome]
MANAEVLVNHLDHRRQAVGGAGRGGDDAVLCRIEQVLVHPHDDVQRALLLHRCAHHHPLHAFIQIGLKHGDGLHLATGLDHQIAVRPVGVGNRLVGGDLDALATDHHAIALGAGLVMPAAMHRIEVQQMRVGHRVTHRVIDADELELRPAPGGAQGQATDTTEAVDTDFDTHESVLSDYRKGRKARLPVEADAQQQAAARSGRPPIASSRETSPVSQSWLASSVVLSMLRTQAGRSG